MQHCTLYVFAQVWQLGSYIHTCTNVTHSLTPLQVPQQEKHANALPYSTVLLPVSHGYTTETAIVLILTFSPVFSVSVPLLLDVSSCSVPSSSWFAGAAGFASVFIIRLVFSIYKYFVMISK